MRGPHYTKHSLIPFVRNLIDDHWCPLSDSLEHQAITILGVIRQEYLDLRRILIEWFTKQQKKYTQHAMICHQLYSFGQCERWLHLIEIALFSFALLPYQLTILHKKHCHEFINNLESHVTIFDLEDLLDEFIEFCKQFLHANCTHKWELKPIQQQFTKTFQSIQSRMEKQYLRHNHVE